MKRNLSMEEIRQLNVLNKVNDTNKKLKQEYPKSNKVCLKNRLNDDFFNKDCLILSKLLLGKYLIRKLDETESNNILIGKIVEVEAYLGCDDKASHTFNNKKTDRLKAMYMKAGTAYVYNIYGMYCCLNISSKEPGAGVLIRALEPVHGIDLMIKNRTNYKPNSVQLKNDKNLIKNLTNGPSKLCISMNITKNLFNQIYLVNSNSLWLQDDLDNFSLILNNNLHLKKIDGFKISSAKRINIDYAGEEAINKLYRFYIKDNAHVSVKSKEAIEVEII